MHSHFGAIIPPIAAMPSMSSHKTKSCRWPTNRTAEHSMNQHQIGDGTRVCSTESHSITLAKETTPRPRMNELSKTHVSADTETAATRRCASLNRLRHVRQLRSAAAPLSDSQLPCFGIELTRPQTKRREPQRQTRNMTGNIRTILMNTTVCGVHH